MPKISELNSSTSPNDADLLPLVSGGITKKIALSALKAFFGGSGSSGGGSSSNSTTIDATDAAYGAKKDGSADARGAINSAMSAAFDRGGLEVFLPAGTYLVKVGPGAELNLKKNVILRGVYGATTILVDATTAGQFTYFSQLTTNAGFRNIIFKRASNFSLVMFGTGGSDNDGFVLDNCVVDGALDLYTGSGIFAHGFQLGNAVTTNLRITSTNMQKLTYPLFQANTSDKRTETVRIAHNTFELNYATDLEFNGPKSIMRDIDIYSNTFRDSRGESAGGWFAVGFANCVDVRVHHNRIYNYKGEGVHIEDGCSSIRVDHNHIQKCGQLSRLSYIQVISYGHNISIDHNYIDGDGDTNFVAYMIGLQIGGSGTTEAGNPFIAPQHIIVDSNQIYAGSAGGIYCETALVVSITNNKLFSRGVYNEGTKAYTPAYAGATAGNHFGVKLYSGDDCIVTGNTINGFYAGLAASDNGVETGGNGWAFNNNQVKNSKYAIPAIDPAHGTINSNTISRCQHSILTGQGAGTAKAVHVGNNAAYDCAYPLEIAGKFVAVATAAASTGSGVSVSIETALIRVPSGTVFAFTGGGSLTLTAAASRGATTLVGNLTGAGIASGAAGTATGIAHSSTAAENHCTGLLSNVDSAGNQWPS